MVSVAAPISNSDHCLIVVTQPHCPNTRPNSEKRTLWKFSSADWDGLRAFYSTLPWDDICFSRLGVNEAATIITQLIMDGMTLFIPHSQPAGKKNSPKWFTKKCEKAVRAKNQAYSNWKANTCPVSFQIFKSARNACKDAIRTAKAQFLNRIAEKLIECPNGSKSFWSLASRITSNFCGSALPPLIDQHNRVVSTAKEKANLLASLFAANAKLDDAGVPTPVGPRAPCSMPKINFMTRKTRKALSKLDISKSSGPDGISIQVMKRCAPELAPVLTKLFQISCDSGVCPTLWKNAEVVPVPKRGDPTNPSNYRPIAITSILCKVMESLLSEQFLAYLENNCLINDR